MGAWGGVTTELPKWLCVLLVVSLLSFISLPPPQSLPHVKEDNLPDMDVGKGTGVKEWKRPQSKERWCVADLAAMHSVHPILEGRRRTDQSSLPMRDTQVYFPLSCSCPGSL